MFEGEGLSGRVTKKKTDFFADSLTNNGLTATLNSHRAGLLRKKSAHDVPENKEKMKSFIFVQSMNKVLQNYFSNVTLHDFFPSRVMPGF